MEEKELFLLGAGAVALLGKQHSYVFEKIGAVKNKNVRYRYRRYGRWYR